MALLITPESEMGQELARWNRPYRFQMYPKMVYLAQRRPDGKVSVGEASDSVFGGNPGVAEAFTRTCQRVVGDEYEHNRARDEGWRDSHAEALERHEAKEQAIADSAAYRNFEDRNMSEKAQREARAADEGMQHVPEITEKPRARRGRPPKSAS